MESVVWIVFINDSVISKVVLVIDFVFKLRNVRIFIMWKFKICKKNISLLKINLIGRFKIV